MIEKFKEIFTFYGASNRKTVFVLNWHDEDTDTVHTVGVFNTKKLAVSAIDKHDKLVRSTLITSEDGSLKEKSSDMEEEMSFKFNYTVIEMNINSIYE